MWFFAIWFNDCTDSVTKQAELCWQTGLNLFKYFLRRCNENLISIIPGYVWANLKTVHIQYRLSDTHDSYRPYPGQVKIACQIAASVNVLMVQECNLLFKMYFYNTLHENMQLKAK